MEIHFLCFLLLFLTWMLGTEDCIWQLVFWSRKWLPTLENSCLENSMDRGVWHAAVHGVTRSLTQLSTAQLVFMAYIVFLLNSIDQDQMMSSLSPSLFP